MPISRSIEQAGSQPGPRPGEVPGQPGPMAGATEPQGGVGEVVQQPAGGMELPMGEAMPGGLEQMPMGSPQGGEMPMPGPQGGGQPMPQQPQPMPQEPPMPPQGGPTALDAGFENPDMLAEALGKGKINSIRNKIRTTPLPDEMGEVFDRAKHKTRVE